MSDFYKVLDAKGRSYLAGENFTDPYVPALQAMQTQHDQVKWDGWVQASLKPRKSSQPTQLLSNIYEYTACRRIDNNQLVLTLYKSQSKQTLIKVVLNDKKSRRKFASIAKSSQKRR